MFKEILLGRPDLSQEANFNGRIDKLAANFVQKWQQADQRVTNEFVKPYYRRTDAYAALKTCDKKFLTEVRQLGWQLASHGCDGDDFKVSFAQNLPGDDFKAKKNLGEKIYSIAKQEENIRVRNRLLAIGSGSIVVLGAVIFGLMHIKPAEYNIPPTPQPSVSAPLPTTFPLLEPPKPLPTIENLTPNQLINKNWHEILNHNNLAGPGSTEKGYVMINARDITDFEQFVKDYDVLKHQTNGISAIPFGNSNVFVHHLILGGENGQVLLQQLGEDVITSSQFRIDIINHQIRHELIYDHSTNNSSDGGVFNYNPDQPIVLGVNHAISAETLWVIPNPKDLKGGSVAAFTFRIR